MRVEYDGKPYFIEFSYGETNAGIDLTVCHILDASRLEVEGDAEGRWPTIALGHASRDSRDTPNRDKGRRVALKDALRHWDLVEPCTTPAGNRYRRTAFWRAYNARKPKVSVVTLTVYGKSVRVRYDLTDPTAKALGELIVTVMEKVRHMSKVTA